MPKIDNIGTRPLIRQNEFNTSIYNVLLFLIYRKNINYVHAPFFTTAERHFLCRIIQFSEKLSPNGEMAMFTISLV